MKNVKALFAVCCFFCLCGFSQGCSTIKKFVGGNEMPEVSAQICKEAAEQTKGDSCKALKANVASCAVAIAQISCEE